MKIHSAVVTCLLFLPAAPALAQPLIGGGVVCSSASLNGSYSLTLSGRDINSSSTLVNVMEVIGTATFDGQSNVTILTTTNTNQSAGLSRKLSGTYSLQAGCSGVMNLTSGDTASFSLESSDLGRNFLITGEDGAYAFSGSGTLLPSSCTSLSGEYAFSGSGFALTAGSVSGANEISGLLQFGASGVVTASWNIGANGTPAAATATGQYTFTPPCTASATLKDSSGNAWSLQFTVTAESGSNFIVSATSPAAMFIGSGHTQATTPACSVSTLTGVLSLVLTGRNVTSSGVLAGSFQGTGSATFDGDGNVVFLLAANTNQLLNQTETLSGTYTLASNCTGTLNISSGDTASFALIASDTGQTFTITGGDGTYALTGNGRLQPASCAISAVSGAYAFSGAGGTAGLTPGSISAVAVSGLLQFDGRGNITGNWSVATNASSTSTAVTGEYSVTSACRGSATVVDSSAAAWTLNFTLTSTSGGALAVDIANATTEFATSGASAFTYPGLAVVNGASAVAGGTPPGSIFALYGSGLATASAEAAKVPLPGMLLTTTVTVNNEAAPLFYVSESQINAQMPLDIQPGTATVVVRNGSSSSNAVSVVVPATAVPGIAVQYPTNQAVVVNQDQSVNTPASPAHVGDTVVAYFTGGGPVNAAGPWVTGAASPNGLSPVVESAQVTVGGQAVTVVNYNGLTPTLVGVYQLNFVIPQVNPGQRDLILTIDGTPSATTTISIAD
jgi:uncharacterized protein (TIGR03437 family)